MRDFVELQGASGASYRFRLWREGESHLPIAGNYAVLQETADGFNVLAADVSDDLSTVRQDLKRPVKDQPGLTIYTRLNVSRAVRMAENDDIAANRQPRRAAQASKSAD